MFTTKKRKLTDPKNNSAELVETSWRELVFSVCCVAAATGLSLQGLEI